jgi:glycosyltransferase involved in cell wall biosynthesis
MDVVITVNDKLEIWARENLHVGEENIYLIKNFPFIKMDYRKDSPGKLVVLNLANFRPQKDQLNLIEAAAIIKKLKFQFEIWLVGSFVDKAWFKLVEQRIKELNLEKEVIIKGPILDIEEVLIESTIGVLCSESEGLPVSLLEYGIAGLPVVVTNVGQCSVVLGNGRFGKIVEPKNSLEMAKAIIGLLENSSSALEMGRLFKGHVEKEYGYIGFFEQYSKILLA